MYLNIKMKKSILLLLVLFQVGLSAQTITIDFSYHPGKAVSLCMKTGTACDALLTGMLDDKGKVIVDLRGKAADYPGIATLSIDSDSPIIMDIIISGKEDVYVSCPEEYPHEGNITFASIENEYFKKWFIGQAQLQQKMNLLNESQKSGNEEDDQFSLLINEIQDLEANQAAFEKELTESKLYIGKFIQYCNFLNKEVENLMYADSIGMTNTRAYVRDSLDVKGLFTSGLWFSTFNGLLTLYDNGKPYHKDFITDMSLLLERAGSERIYHTLAENLFDICEYKGWDDMEEQLANYLTDRGRIENFTDKLKRMITQYGLKNGSTAPGLLQGTLPVGNILLVFHLTGCGPCEYEMQQLKENYHLIKEQGYEVVSVSLDVDEQAFKDTTDTFPWEAKYNDFQGFNSPDAENYGVISTPTFYLIKDGILQGRCTGLMDTGIILNKNH